MTIDKRIERHLDHFDFIGDKQEWRDICAMTPEIPLYFKDWYWDANCKSPNDWWVILVRQQGEVVAAFPFIYAIRKGLYIIENPWQVAAAGLWLCEKEERSFNRSLKELTNIVNTVVDLLPKYDKFSIRFDASLWTWLPFHWRGFSCVPCYTMVIDDDRDIRASLSRKRRNLIKQAERDCNVEVNTISVDEYWAFMGESYKARNRELSFGFDEFRQLVEAASLHDAVQIRTVLNNQAQIISENICFVDEKRLYHHFGTHLPDEHPGAQSLGILDAINEARDAGKAFDFEGSMINGVCSFNSSFNPRFETRYQINASSKKYEVIHCLRRIAFCLGDAFSRNH